MCSFKPTHTYFNWSQKSRCCWCSLYKVIYRILQTWPWFLIFVNCLLSQLRLRGNNSFRVHILQNRISHLWFVGTPDFVVAVSVDNDPGVAKPSCASQHQVHNPFLWFSFSILAFDPWYLLTSLAQTASAAHNTCLWPPSQFWSLILGTFLPVWLVQTASASAAAMQDLIIRFR